MSGWRTPHQKKNAKVAKASSTAAAPKSSDWKSDRKPLAPKHGAHVDHGKAAWTKRSR